DAVCTLPRVEAKPYPKVSHHKLTGVATKASPGTVPVCAKICRIVMPFTRVFPALQYVAPTQRGGPAMTSLWRNRKVRTFIAVALVCGAAVAVSLALAYPQPVSNPTLGAGWQCHRAAGVLTTCSRVSRAGPLVHHPRPVPVDFRRV